MSFLRKKSVGLHLSSDAIRLAVLYKKGKQITAGLFHTEPLTEDVVKDGKIRDYQKLKKLLLSLKKKVEHPERGRGTRFDKVNFSFDHPESDLFKEIKIKILWFEEEAPAAVRAILPAVEDKELNLRIRDKGLGISNPVMLVDIGSDRTIVSVVTNGKIDYCEKLQISSSFIKDLIERGWGLDLFTEEINKHYLDWHLKVTEARKHKNTESTKIQKQGLASNWNLHFSPSTNQDLVKDKGLKINNIILYGSALFYPCQSVKDTCLSVLPEYLMANLKVPVELANVWTNVIPSSAKASQGAPSFDDKIPSISFNDSLGYATAIGLALKGFE